VFTDIPPMYSWKLYIVSKLAAAFIFSSIVFATRSRWWALGFVLLFAVWSAANYIYFRAYSLFLSWSVIRIATNLRGFSDAILIYLDYRLLVLLLPAIVFCGLVWLFPKERKRIWWAFGVCLLAGIGCCMRMNYLIHTIRNDVIGYRQGDMSFEKLLPLYINEIRLVQDWESEYSLVQEHSIAGYLPLSVVYDIKVHKLRSGKDVVLTDEEQALMDSLMPQAEGPATPDNHLIIVLVESFESWALDSTEAMPNLRNLRTSEHSLYAGNMRHQRRYGMSGDGQMIVNTGLLPIESGVACILYGTNRYPSLAEHFPQGMVVSPARGTWNQGTMTYSYGYKALYEPSKIAWHCWNDAEVFSTACGLVGSMEQPTCMQLITVASHAPFDRVKKQWEGVPEDMSDEFKRYLTCLHYTDSCIGALVDTLRAQGIWEQTTLVVTSDHTVFGYDAPKHNRIPFVLVSPHITQSIEVEEECYQMDIYPTVMHVLGIAPYGWAGFGVNLADSKARAERRISPQEAYRISDKLIRGNYFENSLQKGE